MQEDFYKQIDKTDVTDKQKLSASVLLAADAAIEEWLFQDGIRLTVKDILPFLLTNKQIDVNARALDCFYDWLVVNNRFFMQDEEIDHYGRFEDENGRAYSGSTPYAVSVVKSIFNRVIEK